MGKHSTPEPIVTAVIRDDGARSMTAEITHTGQGEWSDDQYTLTWTDGTTKWAESYESVSLAIARLAALKHCEEQDWNAGFTVQPWEFRQQAFKLFDATTSWDSDDFAGWPLADKTGITQSDGTVAPTLYSP